MSNNPTHKVVWPDGSRNQLSGSHLGELPIDLASWATLFRGLKTGQAAEVTFHPRGGVPVKLKVDPIKP